MGGSSRGRFLDRRSPVDRFAGGAGEQRVGWTGRRLFWQAPATTRAGPDRLRVAAKLAVCPHLPGDPRLAQMIWYGINHAVVTEVDAALALAAATESSNLRRWVVRRLASELSGQPTLADQLLDWATPTSEQAVDLLIGMRDGTRGLSRMPAARLVEVGRRF
ncbi:MAG: hypothetical protein R3B96_24670 [Pirellulaceae bacterium]